MVKEQEETLMQYRASMGVHYTLIALKNGCYCIEQKIRRQIKKSDVEKLVKLKKQQLKIKFALLDEKQSNKRKKTED